MKITLEQIESLPAHLESNYCTFRESIRETLAEALENGDAVKSLQYLVGDFMRALNHTLEEFDAPENTLNDACSILHFPASSDAPE
jgi:hypothetical protein